MKKNKCFWTQYLTYPSEFKTSCDNHIVFEDNNYGKNTDYIFCQFCGKEIEEVKE